MEGRERSDGPIER